MNSLLKADRILRNIQELRGLATKRQLADFFGVGPSSITDWVNRKGNRIPSRRLAEACRRHGLRWQWLAYGESPPYENNLVEKASGVPLGPNEIILLSKVKESPAFRSAVERLLGMDEEQVRLIARLAESMSPTAQKQPQAAQERPYRKWRASLPLTNSR